MDPIISSTDNLLTYYQNNLKSAKLRSIGLQLVVMIFFGLLAYFSQKQILYFAGLLSVIMIAMIHRNNYKKTYRRVSLFKTVFPTEWRDILTKHSLFFQKLNDTKRAL